MDHNSISPYAFMAGIGTNLPLHTTIGCEPSLCMWLALVRCSSEQHDCCLVHIFFFFSAGATTHCGFVFCSPLVGYSLLAYEVS